MRKLAIIGGGGVRTPLLIYGLAHAERHLGAAELTLYDLDAVRTETIARIGREVVRRMGASLQIRTCSRLEEAADGADFVLSSIRVGGMASRARDERIAIEHGLAGQETTGPAGAAMALRTIPVTLGHAKVVERVSPRAWFINFTNPAGLITQALAQSTNLNVIGICDTPGELFHKIAAAVKARPEDVVCDYVGLNHLGWVRRVQRRGEDVTANILDDSPLLRGLYPSGMFDPALIQSLRLIPTEYLFFYYSQRKAYQNQLAAGASRGEELTRMNQGLFERLSIQTDAELLATYTNYIQQRNATYMKLEGSGVAGPAPAADQPDPFETATGYHRIALDVMNGLVGDRARQIVLNVPNRRALDDLEADDVVEVPCDVDRTGARPQRIGRLPEQVRGLTLSVKAYERTAIRAALQGSCTTARLALFEHPSIAQWELAGELLSLFQAADPEHLGYLR